MSSMAFNQKIFTPTAPDKGSFPLDHENLCKKEMIKYMQCLRINRFDNAECRAESKQYLGCRMDNQLMTKEPWSKLGLEDVPVPSLK